MKHTLEFIKAVKGEYYFISPYHKNKKKLPFIINGNIHSKDFPIAVSTVEYKGWEKNYIITGYTINAINELIEKGKIKRLIN